MYKRFTDRCRQAMRLANQEAERLNHEYMSTEHILLGLVKEGGGVAADLLKDFDVQLHTVIEEVNKLLEKEAPVSLGGRIPPTPRAKKVIEYAMEEARKLNDDYVGTEHILLGLLREEEGVAAQLLMTLGLRLELVRTMIQANPESFDDEGRFRSSGDNPPPPVRPLDDDSKRRVRELAEELAALERGKFDAVANQDFDEAAQLRDKQDRFWIELRSLHLPRFVLKNVKRLVRATTSRFPLLDMLCDDAGEPDAAVLSMLPNPMMPPVKIVVGAIPRHPVSTLQAVLAQGDIGSPFFQALVPLISPESVGQFKGSQKEMARLVFSEIGRTKSPVVLCVVRPTALPGDVQEELYAGIHGTECDFVLFETPGEAGEVRGKLPPGTTLLGG